MAYLLWPSAASVRWQGVSLHRRAGALHWRGGGQGPLQTGGDGQSLAWVRLDLQVTLAGPDGRDRMFTVEVRAERRVSLYELQASIEGRARWGGDTTTTIAKIVLYLVLPTPMSTPTSMPSHATILTTATNPSPIPTLLIQILLKLLPYQRCAR